MNPLLLSEISSAAVWPQAPQILYTPPAPRTKEAFQDYHPGRKTIGPRCPAQDHPPPGPIARSPVSRKNGVATRLHTRRISYDDGKATKIYCFSLRGLNHLVESRVVLMARRIPSRESDRPVVLMEKRAEYIAILTLTRRGRTCCGWRRHPSRQR